MTEIIINKRNDLENKDADVLVRYIYTSVDGDCGETGRVYWQLSPNYPESLNHLLKVIGWEIERNERLYNK